MNSIALITGNLCSLLALCTDSYSSTRKTVKEILLVQCVSQLIYCIGTIALKGYSAAVQNFINILRNIAAIRNIENKYLEWLLVVLGVALGVAFNNLGAVGLLPVFANLQYTLVMFRCKNDERKLKASFLICVISFIIFNAAIYNIVGTISNTVIMFTTAYALYKSYK